MLNRLQICLISKLMHKEYIKITNIPSTKVIFMLEKKTTL